MNITQIDTGIVAPIVDCEIYPAILVKIIPISIFMFLISILGLYLMVKRRSSDDFFIIMILAINTGVWLCLFLALLLFG